MRVIHNGDAMKSTSKDSGNLDEREGPKKRPKNKILLGLVHRFDRFISDLDTVDPSCDMMQKLWQCTYV